MELDGLKAKLAAVSMEAKVNSEKGKVDEHEKERV